MNQLSSMDVAYFSFNSQAVSEDKTFENGGQTGRMMTDRLTYARVLLYVKFT